jgi:hypothetical protein
MMNVRSFLEQKKNVINAAAFFVTCTALGGKKVLQDMTNLYGKRHRLCWRSRKKKLNPAGTWKKLSGSFIGGILLIVS